MGSFLKDPSKDKVTIKLAPISKTRLINLMNKENLNVSETITFLLNFYYEDDLSSIKHLRRLISKRVKKGINHLYKLELEKLQETLDNVLKLL